MDYLKLVQNLKKEVFEAGREKYKSLNKFIALIHTLMMIPLRIGFFFGRLGYWFTWFFFKGISAPVDYLQAWFDKNKDNMSAPAQVVFYLVCLPSIWVQQVYLAFNSFFFFMQWFGLMLGSYIMTLGAIRWQPVISDATFDEN